MAVIICYDIGTTGGKTCLYEAGRAGVTLLASASVSYPLTLLKNGGVEQDPEDWWNGMCVATRRVLEQADLPPERVEAASFCSQMQCLALVDIAGRPVRPAMSYMDKRATAEFEAWRKGPLQIAGVTLPKLLVSLLETGVVAASGKDPVFRYAWVRANEPEHFRRVHKWLDAKEALICRATGKFVMSRDSAFGTLLYDARKDWWSERTARLHNVEPAHLPRIVRSTDAVGSLTEAAAAELGLTTRTVVYAGGGDSSLIGLGSGCAKPGQTHVYIGTSGWVSTVVDKQMVDVSAMIASVVGAEPGLYNYFAEMETAGKCFEWARDQLAADSIGLYPEKRDQVEAGVAPSLLAVLDRVVASAPPGSGGVLFTPWLLGNRCPFEDADCRGMFFNVGLGTTKAELIRSVYEGVLYHLRWMLERQGKKTATSKTVRVAGGGAKSDVLCQMLADVLGRPVERTAAPQNAGALGACLVAAAGMGIVDTVAEGSGLLPVERRFLPDPAVEAVHGRNYRAFVGLYASNRKNYALLNR